MAWTLSQLLNNYGITIWNFAIKSKELKVSADISTYILSLDILVLSE